MNALVYVSYIHKHQALLDHARKHCKPPNGYFIESNAGSSGYQVASNIHVSVRARAYRAWGRASRVGIIYYAVRLTQPKKVENPHTQTSHVLGARSRRRDAITHVIQSSTNDIKSPQSKMSILML